MLNARWFEIYSLLIKNNKRLKNLKHRSPGVRMGRIFILHTDEDGVMVGGVCYTTLLEDEKASLLEFSRESSQPTVYPA